MKYLSLFMILAMLVVGCTTQTMKTTIQPSQPSLVLSSHEEQGEVIVDISAASIPHIQGAQFDLRYDPALLKFDKAVEGPMLNHDGTQTMFLTDNNQQPGVVKNVGIMRISTMDATGDGVLATISFFKTGKGTTALFLEKVIIVDNTSTKVAVQTPSATLSLQ